METSLHMVIHTNYSFQTALQFIGTSHWRFNRIIEHGVVDDGSRAVVALTLNGLNNNMVIPSRLEKLYNRRLTHPNMLKKEPRQKTLVILTNRTRHITHPLNKTMASQQAHRTITHQIED